MRKFLLVTAVLFASLVQAQLKTVVMSYNIRFDSPNDGENKWEIRRGHLAGLVRYHDPEFLGVQEALHHQLQYLQESLPNFKWIGVGRDDGQQKGEYSALLYRADLYECLQQKTVWLSPTPDKPSKGWDAALERICTYGLFKHKKSKKLIWVMNTHFDHVGKEARLESAKQLWQLAESLQQQKKIPLVLMGDLNVRPEDPPLVFLNSVMDHARNLCAQPYGNPDTWNAFRFKEKPNGQIDHIFLHRAFPATVLKYATITDSYDLKYPSDHLPVLANLQFK